MNPTHYIAVIVTGPTRWMDCKSMIFHTLNWVNSVKSATKKYHRSVVLKNLISFDSALYFFFAKHRWRYLYAIGHEIDFPSKCPIISTRFAIWSMSSIFLTSKKCNLWTKSTYHHPAASCALSWSSLHRGRCTTFRILNNIPSHLPSIPIRLGHRLHSSSFWFYFIWQLLDHCIWSICLVNTTNGAESRRIDPTFKSMNRDDQSRSCNWRLIMKP